MAGFLVFSAGLSAQGNGSDPGIIAVQDSGTMVTFAGGTAKVGGTLHVRIDGPGGSNVFDSTSQMGLVDWVVKANMPDGTYVYDAWFTPTPAQGQAKEQAGKSAEQRVIEATNPSSQLKAGSSKPVHRSGVFQIQSGAVQPTQDPDASIDHEISAAQPEPSAMERLAGAVLEFLVPAASAGTCSSPCDVGTGESQVTLIPSSGDSWEIETASNGSFYRIGPDGGTTEPFKLGAGAPVNSLFIEGTTGDIGMGTGTPDTSLEIDDTFANISLVDTDNGPQDYELLNNGGNFYIIDRTHSVDPFVILPNASLGATFLLTLNNGGVAVGNFVTPLDALHVRGTGSDATKAIRVEDSQSATANRRLFYLTNNGDPLFRLENTANAVQWDFRTTTNGFSITKVGTGQLEAEVRNSGDFAIAGSYLTSSSRNLKEDIVPLDNDTVLGKLDQLTVAEWQYIRNPSERHVGPMAEDFYATFGLGPDNKHVVAADMAGVALAAAKALKAENAQLKAESASKDKEISALAARVARLEKLMEQGQ